MRVRPRAARSMSFTSLRLESMSRTARVDGVGPLGADRFAELLDFVCPLPGESCIVSPEVSKGRRAAVNRLPEVQRFDDLAWLETEVLADQCHQRVVADPAR